MKRKIILLFISLLAVVALAACAGDDEGSSSGLSGTITMAGSTSVQPLSDELANAFMNIHRDTRLEVSGGGSGAGITAAQENTADFGAVSRVVRDDELGIDTHTIAIDGIAIIVHADNDISDLALEEIQQLFAGDITNWSEVGGADEDVVVVSREEGSGTRGAFDDLVLGDETLVGTALIQNSTGAVKETVKTEPNAIGYISLGNLDDEIKGLKVDGAEPTAAAISSGDYTVSRPFNYVTNEDEDLSELAQAFLDFVLSDDGQAVVVEQGFIAVD